MTKKQTGTNVSQNPAGCYIIDGRKNSFLNVPGAYDNPLMKDEVGVDGGCNGIRKDSVFGTDIYSLQQHDTYEASPCAANYRNSLSISKYLRPTLEELHNPEDKHKQSRTERDVEEGDEKPNLKPAVKFGWVRGVFLRCILNIWGVMLFLRMAWMTGQSGISGSLGIIALSTVVTMITTMSMSAICTNGEVKGGGAYYLISRSLGPEIGGAVGIIFAFANSLAVAMYIVGAGEAVRDILRTFNVSIVPDPPSDVNDVRIAGFAFLIFVACVTGIGMAFENITIRFQNLSSAIVILLFLYCPLVTENITQIVLLILLLVALVNYFVGACLPPTTSQIAKGFVGWKLENGKDNFFPDYRDGYDFFGVFSIFFPSVIGILAGANISGDLKNPSSALPKGTFLAIITTSLSYIVVVIWTGFTLVRDASGIEADVLNGTFTDCENRKCNYGMMQYNQMMEVSAGFGPLIYAGVFAATLSSALAALVSAPRLFQALCKDEIFPYIKFFAKGYGRNNDPRRATVLALLIAFAFTCYGDLNKVAPIISNFYMATYCLINFACFHASIVKSPGFRPGFKYYNMWVSAIGAILCLACMFVMSWIIALITFCVVVLLYVYVFKAKPDVNWGSSAQGFSYKNAMLAVLRLNKVDEHVKNFRPSILVLTGSPYSRPSLVDFASSLTKNTGLTFCGHVVKERLPYSVSSVLVRHNNQWLMERGVKAFYCCIQNEKLSDGVNSLLQAAGLGKLRPNILLIGFKNDWDTVNIDELHDYFDVIHHAFDRHLSVAIFRTKGGFNYGKYFETDGGFPFGGCSPKFESEHQRKLLRHTSSNDSEISTNDTTKHNEPTTPPVIQIISTSGETGVRKPSSDATAELSHFKQIDSDDMAAITLPEVPDEILERTEQFRRKQNKGTIDVWWLYDDGGLTILMPYLLTTRAKWNQCQLRVFSVTQTGTNLDQAQVNMAALLKKFRINISSVIVLSDLNDKPPSDESKRKFKSLISNWMGDDSTEPSDSRISKTDLASHKQKTCRHLRLAELLKEHSKEANLIVMSLPMPRKGSCPAPLYMAWLDMLTQDMPPFLMVRGNQTNMLTFYS